MARKGKRVRFIQPLQRRGSHRKEKHARERFREKGEGFTNPKRAAFATPEGLSWLETTLKTNETNIKHFTTGLDWWI